MLLALFSDWFRLVAVFDRKRFMNLIRLKISYFFYAYCKKNKQKNYPAFLTVEPTTACNLQCLECFTSTTQFTRPKGQMQKETFEKIISQLKQKAFYLNLYFQGEPFLHERLTDFIKIAKQNRFYVAVSTNGHFLDKKTVEKLILSGLDRLIISLDGCDAETYQKYRRKGDFDLVLNNIKRLVQIRLTYKAKYPFIELQCLCTKENQHQFDTIKKLGKSIGVDKISLKTLQLLHPEKATSLLPETHSRYFIDKEGKVIIKNKFTNRCFRMWSSCVFTWDGDIIPCCFDKNAKYDMGNILDDGFEKIWFGEKYENFRIKVFSERKNIDICTNCSVGLYK